RSKSERFHIVSNLLYFEKFKLAMPTDFPRHRIVFLIAWRFRSKQGRRWAYLDVLAARAGTGETLSESQKKLRISLEADLARDERADQALLLREESEPCSGVGSDMDIRFAD